MLSKNSSASKIERWMRRARPKSTAMSWALLFAAALVAVDAARPWRFGSIEPVEAIASAQSLPSPAGQAPASAGGSASVEIQLSQPAPGGARRAVKCAPCDTCKDCESRIAAALKDLEARIDKDRKDAEDRLDKWMDTCKWILELVIALAGIVFPAIGGIAAYLNVKTVRDDAKDLLDKVEKRTKEIEKESRLRLDELVAQGKAQLDQYQQNFPQFTAMDERVQALMGEMERRMPREEDWNNVDSFRKLSEADRQYILDSEVPVAAMSVFNLGNSPKLRPRLSAIYAVFARFYLGRYQTPAGGSESDFWRAVSYADRVIHLDPGDSGGYRLRGAIHLARYERLSKAALPADANAREQSLNSAELDLSEAIRKGTADYVDAGAYYNQALVRYYRGDIEGAIQVSRQLLGLESKLSRLHREKYLPSIYVNLASFLAMLAERAKKQNQQEAERQFGIQAVEAVARGVENFKKTEMQDRGLSRLKELLGSELDSDQELNRLEQAYRKQLEDMLRSDTADGAQGPT